jgi:hypothetical protein
MASVQVDRVPLQLRRLKNLNNFDLNVTIVYENYQTAQRHMAEHTNLRGGATYYNFKYFYTSKQM